MRVVLPNVSSQPEELVWENTPTLCVPLPMIYKCDIPTDMPNDRTGSSNLCASMTQDMFDMFDLQFRNKL